MPIALILPGLAILLAGSSIMNWIKRSRIRRNGTCVMAKVIQVHSWNNSVVQGNSLLPKFVPLLTAGWQYEIIGEWTDPSTNETYSISSGRKNGLPKYQRGDMLSAYISPEGNYLEL